MSFDVTILGCGSATPTSQRNPTAQVINALGRFFLVDCGEATQIQMRKFKIRIQKINHIFISHLHGDHYLGLTGFLSSLHLLGRTDPIHLYANSGLKEIIDTEFKHSETSLKYKIIWHFLSYEGKQLLFEDKVLEIYSFPLNHRIPTCGFLFKEKPKPLSIIKEMVIKHNLTIEQIQEAKNGSDLILEDGSLLCNRELTRANLPSKAYAYCSDTIYDEAILPFISGVDLLYHETTFMEDMSKRAKETYHSTSKDAAHIAQKAGVKQLLIGHYSARYRNIDALLEEAISIFSNTLAAEEGKVYRVV